MPAPTIKQVSYRVTGEFGVSELGSMRVAYRIGQDSGSDRALVFHPKDKDGSGSIEFCSITKDSTNRLLPIYQSYPALPSTSNDPVQSYVNLSSGDEKFYRGLVETAGFTIPKKLTLSPTEPDEAPGKSEPTRPRRRPAR